jgi:alanine racemase
MDYASKYSTWAEIDLGAIEENVRILQGIANVQVMAVIKANAYGHGMVPVARAALRGGASWCGVARLEEAVELRRAEIYCPVLILGYTPPARYDEAIANQISLTVWEPAHLQAATAAAARLGQPARLHLKVDSGMNRLGVRPEGAFELARQMAGAPGMLFEGLFTHFARSDETDLAPTLQQERVFAEVVRSLEASRLLPPKVHAANSAAALVRPTAAYNLVRGGIAIYGLHPSPECALPPGFRPALAWKTVISHVKTLPPGQGVSYGHEYITRCQERIGTAPVGYADGFRRKRKHIVLVGGQRVEVVSRVCMDQIMLLLAPVPQARPGDEVMIIGAQGDERISAEEVAERWSTNNYEIVCGIGPRVPRLYSGDKG